MSMTEADPVDAGVLTPDLEPSLAQVKMKGDALDKLAPDPDEQDERMSLITVFRGKQPHLYLMYQADVQWEILTAYEMKRPVDWSKLNPVTWIKNNAPSIQGRRAKEIVAVASTTGVQQRHSLWDVLRGGNR